MKCLLLVMALAGAAAAVAAPKSAAPRITSDPLKEMAEQQNVIVESLYRGESRERACAIVAQQFSLSCTVRGKDFVLIRGVGTKITYLATLRVPGK
ncbi:hypothetical protein [Duganella sp. HH105]|uniref:hypothetical protein n=1 Tax=Duganella sp. HH105 TaxID=1781067 RepID=UPI000877D5A2|nr:hypothetical protein [Duganella sp. HH105]OEZ63772.1 hypothetical protein DUGA6_02730 [Duganella sp. HH105]